MEEGAPFHGTLPEAGWYPCGGLTKLNFSESVCLIEEWLDHIVVHTREDHHNLFVGNQNVSEQIYPGSK